MTNQFEFAIIPLEVADEKGLYKHLEFLSFA